MSSELLDQNIRAEAPAQYIDSSPPQSEGHISEIQDNSEYQSNKDESPK
jgi:hypothetical protein